MSTRSSRAESLSLPLAQSSSSQLSVGNAYASDAMLVDSESQPHIPPSAPALPPSLSVSSSLSANLAPPSLEHEDIDMDENLELQLDSMHFDSLHFDPDQFDLNLDDL